MSDESIVQPDEGSVALPEVKASVPKSDFEAGPETPADVQPESETPKPDESAEKQERQKNRTKAYIDRLNAENADLRRRSTEWEASKAQPSPVKTASTDDRTFESFDYDIAAFTAAKAAKAVEEAMDRRQQQETSKAEQAKEHEASQAYQDRLDTFTDDHADFAEVVGSIDPALISKELSAAIMRHPNGPLIAYHLGTNDDDLFSVASVQPQLAAAAVDRLAKRLAAAQTAPNAVAAPLTPKPITRAPAPPPTLTGRSPSDTPSEKLTDEGWLSRERDKARKR